MVGYLEEDIAVVLFCICDEGRDLLMRHCTYHMAKGSIINCSLRVEIGGVQIRDMETIS